MAQRKVVESERSPSVTSANWKEHILLQKQMYLLGKNERTVSHRISVEQKVLCKRFQWKLRHSKLQHARIVQDKSMERDIRTNNAFTFNTNVGLDGDNDEALRKIWARGRQEIAGRCSPARKGTKPGSTLFKKWDSISLDSDTDRESTTKPMKQNRPQTSVSIVTPTLRPRPVSAHPLRGEQSMESGDVTKRRTRLPAYIGTPGKDNRNDTEDGANNEDNNDDGSFIDERDSILPIDGARRPRAKSAHPTGFMKLVIESNDRPEVNINPTVASRRSIPKSSPTPNIFNMEKKPTLLDLHRERLLVADYDSRIRIFANSLEGLQADQRHLSDYYTMRLIQNSLNERKKTNRPPATPITDYVRAIGDVRVRPITFKTLDYNYDKLSSTSFRQPCS